MPKVPGVYGYLTKVKLKDVLFILLIVLFVYLCGSYDAVSKSHSMVVAHSQEERLRSTFSVCL